MTTETGPKSAQRQTGRIVYATLTSMFDGIVVKHIWFCCRDLMGLRRQQLAVLWIFIGVKSKMCESAVHGWMVQQAQIEVTTINSVDSWRSSDVEENSLVAKEVVTAGHFLVTPRPNPARR